MITCNQKALRGQIVSVLIFLIVTLACVTTGHAQTPITQNPCDPRSTANNNTCPTACTFPVGTGNAPNLTGGVERGCNCFDNLDNDGDGKIDAVDNECAQYFGLAFVGSSDSNCSITPPGGNPFVGIGPPKGSDQNTADTQSKVAVGDINGDGVPESVITSKWASTVRVVNADGKTELATYGLSTGNKNEFTGFTDVDGKTCTPNRPLFEHEVLIADIRRGPNLFPDKKGEIFAVVSMRGGNPKTPPEGFYLIGLTYVTGQNTLQRMYDPVPLGTNRPGTFGIADMDGDGYAEIYLRDRIYAAETGKLLASEGSKTHLNTSLWDLDVTSAPSAVDVNGDNALELICGPRIYTMPTLTNRNVGTPAALTLYKDMNAVPGFEKYFVKIMNDPTEYGYDSHSSTSVADIDLDGNIDVIITGAITSGAGRTAVFYWNVAKNTQDFILTPNSTELGYTNTGTTEEKARYDNYKDGWIWGTGRINIGDADGNGKPDLSFIAGNQLFCMTTNASDKLVTLWTQNAKIVNYGGGVTKSLGYREINDSRSGVLTVTIYDFNNDGKPEMVYRDSQSLNVIDGATGVTTFWSVVCQSHTYTEGPIIADVNGDGATDICVTCNTSNSFKIDDDIQQQALGQIRLYFSSGNTWLPTRKVWNQPGYFVANINDNLTLPFPQLKQNLVFSNEPCPNGLPGPQRPLNVFLNQVPYLNANGCPVFPAPDLTFVGDDPELFPNSTNKAVIVTPPICGNLNAIVNVRIGNVGDLPISDLVPVSFFDGDPRLPGSTFLSMTKIQVTNLQTETNFLSADIPVPTSGKVFDLYIALYHDHAVDPMPISATGQSKKECSIENNVYKVPVRPTPFTAVITKFQDNIKCVVTDPNSGELRTSIFIGPDPAGSTLPYDYQWYFGDGTTNPVPTVDGGQSAIITKLAEGDYTLVVTNRDKGCSAAPVKATILLDIKVPPVTITKLSDQTKCEPFDGSLSAQVEGGNTGYTFEWFNSVKSIGITTPEANGLPFETYTVRVSRNGCTNIATESIADFAIEPDATAQVLQDVVSCADLQSGIVTGEALISNVVQDPSEYTFNWYFYNNVAQTRGSILPAENGTGPTRQDLDFGFYQLEVIRNSTKCPANQSPIVEVKNSTKIPVAFIAETLPQTSCDPAQSNGVFTASVQIDNVPQSVNDYDFEWFSLDGTDPAFIHNTVSGINNSVAEQVKGIITYTVRVTNKVSKCFDTEKRVITSDVQIPIITLEKIDNSICDPALGYTGKLTATVEFRGQTITDFTNYKFEWDEGTIMTAPFITVADDKSPVLDKLNGGLNPDGTLMVNGGKYYVATVENLLLHCKSLPAEEEIRNVVDLPELEMVSTPSTNCIVGKENGSVSLTQVDLLPGPVVKPPDNTYNYQWYKGPQVDPAAIINGATSSSLIGVQGGPSPLATGLIANGEYTVDVVNTVNGCRNEKMFQVGASQVKPDLALVPKDNDICDITIAPGGKYTGEMDANPSYTGLYTGTKTFEYKWFTGEYTGGVLSLPEYNSPNPPVPVSTEILLNLPAGFYTATVTIAELGCTSDPESEEVKDIANRPEIEGTPAPSTNCIVNKENGSVTLTQVESLPAFKAPDNTYLYQWYKGPDINAPGSIITGATNSNLTGVQGGPSPLATGLIANGEYTIVVINTTNGCRNEKMFQVGASQVKPDLALVPKDNDICDITIAPGGKYTGEMAGNPTYTGLYTGPITYSYKWYDGEYTGGAFTLLQRPSSPTTSPLIELPAAFYTATVTIEELGCTSDYESEEVEDIANRPEIEGTPAPSTNCIVNKENGSVTLTQVESLPAFKAPDNTYLYQWYKGPDINAPGSIITGATNSNLTGVQGGPSPLATGLIANGEYTIVVINTTNGCRNEKMFQVGASQVKPDLALVPKDNDICDITIAPGGKYTGEMDANPSYTGLYTGTKTYEYKWYSGEYTGGAFSLTEYSSPFPPVGPVPVTTEVLLNLPAAFYTATVTIAELGCTSDYESEEVKDLINVPEVEGTTLASTNCEAGKENGSATLTQVDLSPTLETPANPNYTYKWYMGPAVDPDPAKIIATTSTLTGVQGGPGALADAKSPLLVNGEYTVLVTNITNGCSTPKVFQIADKHVTPVVAMASSPNTICDPTVATSGNYDGTVTATPTITFLPASAPLAGPAVWSYNWSAGAGPNGSVAIVNVTNKGTGYTNATVTINGDGAGATAVAIINDLGQITGIKITNEGANYTNATVGIAGDGTGAAATAEVHASGPLNSASAVLTNLQGGFYSVTATITELGCTSDLEPIEVEDELWEPIIDVATILQTSCTTTPNGALAATVNETTLVGGNGAGQNDASDYAFTWYTDWNANPVDPSGTPWIAPGALVPPATPNGTINVLPGNKYYAVYATRKATGCVASRKPFLGEDIKIPVVSLTKNSDFTACIPPNGSITANVDIAPASPTQTYQFYWLREKPNDITTDSDDVIASVTTDTYPNRLVTGGIGSQTDTFLQLIYGDFTVVVRDNYTNCISMPTTINLVDKTRANITLSGNPVPSACGFNDGTLEISAVRNDAVISDFKFSLFKGGPTNPTLPIVFSYLGVSVNEPTFDGTLQAQDGGYPKLANTALPGLPNPTIPNLGSFIYTVIAEDDFGCKNYKTYFLPFLDAHGITTSFENSSICPDPFDPGNIQTGNGSMSVRVSLLPTTPPGSNANETSFSYAFYKGGVPGVGALAATKIANLPQANPYLFTLVPTPTNCSLPVNAGHPDCNFDFVNTTIDLAPGLYTVEVKELLTAGQCPVYETIEIKQAVLPPLLNLVGALKANDACDVIASANGEATVEINLNAADESLTFGAVTYDITAFDDTNTQHQQFLNTTDGDVTDGVQQTISALKPSRVVDPYTIRVATKINGILNGCVSDMEIAIPDKPTIAELVSGDLTIIDAEYCTPTLERSAKVIINDVRLSNGNIESDISDYEFKWATNSAVTSVVYTANGSLVVNAGGDEFINDLPIGTGTVAPGTVTVGSYWVRLEKKADNSLSGGIGCLSAPFKVTIGDKTVDPIATLTPFSNTACDGNFEGQMKIEATTATLSLAAPYTNPGFGTGFGTVNYTYLGLTAPAPALLLTGSGNGDGVVTPVVDNDIFTNRSDGSYSVRITNDVTGCFVEKTRSIDKISPPVFTFDTDFDNQNLCFPSGKIEVTETYVDGVADGGTGNFVFRWYDTNPGATVNPLTDGNPLQDPGNVVIGNDLLNNINYPTIGAGDFFVKAIRTTFPGSGCASALVKVDLLDVSQDPSVTLTPFANTSCDEANLIFEGSIQVAITEQALTRDGGANPGVGQQYVFDWTTATSTPISDSNGLPLPPTGPYTGDGVANPPINTFIQLQDGFYTLLAYNNLTGCSDTDTKEIIKNETPVILTKAVTTPQNLCFPSGSSTVTEVQIVQNGAATTKPLGEFTYEWATDVTMTSPIGDATTNLNVGNYPTIIAGSYFVRARRNSGLAFAPGSGCVSPVVKVIIDDVSEDPKVALTPLSNTSCEPSTFEGSMKVLITEEPLTGDGNANPGVGKQYVYDWTSATATPIPDIGDLTLTGGKYTGTGLAIPADYTQLEHGLYTLKVYNNETGCFDTDTREILKNEIPVIITKADVTHQNLCFPSGTSTVTEVKIVENGVSAVKPFGEFTYEWATDVGMTSIVGDATRFLTVTNFPAIAAGSYFVRAKRGAFTPGAGCISPAVKVIIDDVSEDPKVRLTPFANTACDDANVIFEGSIQVAITEEPVTRDGVANPGVGQQYVFDWTTATSTPISDSNGLPLPPAGPYTGDGVANPPINTYIQLQDGFYTLLAYNNQTGCSDTDTKEIIKNEIPVIVTKAITTPQNICFPSGTSTVTEVQIIQNGTATTKPLGEFTYQWATDVTMTSLIGDATINLNVGNYPTIGAGSYFVRARRNSGVAFAPGSGCVSPVVKVIIEEDSKDPKTQFGFTPNSSCNNENPNAVIEATALERNNTVDTYTFEWKLNDVLLPIPVPQPGSKISESIVANTSTLTDAPEGKYTVNVFNTVTGCEFLSGIDVNIDLTISLPNIITVDKIEPTTCIGDGTAQVTSISVGGGPALTTGSIEPPAFEYEWYDTTFDPASLLAEITPVLSNIKTGKYYVLVKDLTTDCKSRPTEVVLVDQDIVYPSIEITLTSPQISCDQTVFGTGVLRAVVTADNSDPLYASPDYTFEWFPNLKLTPPNFALTPAGPSNINVITDLTSGNYSLQVINSKTGCANDAIYIVPDNAPQYLPQLVTSSFERTLCVGQDGSVFASIVNIKDDYPFINSLDYTADLFFGDKVNDPALPSLTPDVADLDNVPGFPQNFSTMNNLAEGKYTVRVVDNNTGCVSLAMEEVIDGRKYPQINIVAESPNIICDDAKANGQLFATADGNRVDGYTFDWYTGASIATGATPIVINNSRLIGRVAGDYSVRVTKDLTGCQNDKNGKIVDGRIFPPAPTALVVSDNTNCITPDNPTPNGWVSAHVSCNTIDYIFKWYDGTTTTSSPNFVGADYFERNKGSYTVTATDIATQCLSLPATVTVADISVLPQVVLTSTPEECRRINGTISLEHTNFSSVTQNVELCGEQFVIDKTSALTEIEWRDGSNNSIGTGIEIFGLEAGFYSVDFVTNAGCKGTATGEVGTEILSYNLVSVNGDGANDVWIVDCLEKFPNNNVKIFNRSGIKVYEANYYDNAETVFRGIGEIGVYALGDKLPDGTYFYIIDKGDGSKPKTGYLELVR